MSEPGRPGSRAGEDPDAHHLLGSAPRGQESEPTQRGPPGAGGYRADHTCGAWASIPLGPLVCTCGRLPSTFYLGVDGRLAWGAGSSSHSHYACLWEAPLVPHAAGLGGYREN